MTKLDAEELLRSDDVGLADQLLYLDPPYFEKGAELYTNFYEYDDHERISQVVSSLPSPWVVTYDAVPEIEKLYRGFDHITYGLSYSAGRQRRGREILYVSPGMRLPSADSPTNISVSVVDRRRLA